jgi:hypothetical protein
MRIWDTFMFRDELDMLECRLRQFEQYPVYRHVLVEAPVNHRGQPKPLVYAENKERFAPWADQIVHVVADNLAEIGGNTREAAWAREGAQRDAIGSGLDSADPGDALILADVDEIPNATAIQSLLGGWQGVFEMTCCIFAVDWVWDQLKTSPVTRVETVTSFADARRGIWNYGPVLPGSGHHLSWMGGVPGVQAKLDSTAHTEAVDEIAATLEGEAFYRHGANPFGRYGYSGPLHPVDVDETWPKWVYERQCPAGWFRPR